MGLEVGSPPSSSCRVSYGASETSQNSGTSSARLKSRPIGGGRVLLACVWEAVWCRCHTDDMRQTLHVKQHSAMCDRSLQQFVLVTSPLHHCKQSPLCPLCSLAQPWVAP
jgi:hypothetical protein